MDVASVVTLVVLAIFLAVQPWSVLAAILLVTAEGGMKKELAFVCGWVLALSAVAGATVWVFPDLPQSSTASTGRSAVQLFAGLALAAWLWWRWRHPKHPGTDSQPSWMARLDAMSPLIAFLLGGFLPNYFVVIAAVDEMMSVGLSQATLALVAVVWVLLASTGVASPLAVLLRPRDRVRASEIYGGWRVWITAHSRLMLYSVGAVVCAFLVVQGLVGLIT